MAEPHRESQRKGVASVKVRAESVGSTNEIEQLVVRFNAAKGEIIKVEKVDKTGRHQELTEKECAKLAGQDEVEEIQAALEEAFEAGVAVMLGDEAAEDDEEGALRQLLVERRALRLLHGARMLRRRKLRRLKLRRLLLAHLLSERAA